MQASGKTNRVTKRRWFNGSDLNLFTMPVFSRFPFRPVQRLKREVLLSLSLSLCDRFLMSGDLVVLYGTDEALCACLVLHGNSFLDV